MDVRLRIPCKTFLIGEYAVLEGGPCLGAATAPHFEMTFSRSDNGAKSYTPSFHPDSPAGKFSAAHARLFENLKVQFFDPLDSRGGFGASTAQYLGLWAYREMMAGSMSWNEVLQPLKIKAMVHEYRTYATSSEGRSPSGADLVFQLVGGLCWMDSATWEIQKMKWPWVNSVGYFISTGNKLSTHLHLQQLGDFNSTELFRILQKSRLALKTTDLLQWLESLHEYSQALDLLGLVSPETSLLLKAIRDWPGVQAAKGCGALGADVIFCVVKTDHDEDFQLALKTHQLKLIASTQTMSAGVEIHPLEIRLRQELS